MKNLLILFAIIYCCSAVIETDFVSNLPGYPSQLNFSMYSGLLSLPDSNSKQIHYVLLTKAGEKTPFNDAPLILWLNGGPGCSSLDGWLIENGPFILEDGQKEFNGTYNIWSWNQFANILYFEAPAGVGFSPASSDTTYNDSITTRDNYNALLTFFSGFPELLGNDFWISGESYAGIYVPFLGAYIDDQNKLLAAPVINLQGIMVGNGVASWTNNLFTQVDFYYGHYLIPSDVYSAFYQYCSQSTTSASCTTVLNQINDLTSLVNPYDIYRYCYTDDTRSPRGWLFNQWLPGVNYELRETENFKIQGLKGSDVPCLYSAGVNQYLNRADVKKALHVNPDTEFVFCNLTINSNYVISPEGSVSKYQQLMQNNYKVLIYSGDTDAAVPYTSTLNWIENLNLGVKEAWRPWYQGDQVSGFVQVYNGLTFVTVKGVGHQVPAWKHQEGYVLIYNFMRDLKLPSKNTKKVIA